jgi:two-component system, NtrC family, sensor kinase
MKAFVWSPKFESGITSVDEQHQRLVEIVNRLGQLLITGGATDAATTAVFQELAAYAQFHFGDEERVMSTAGVSQQHVVEHCQHHRQFVEQLTGMWKSRATLANPAEVLHGFLASWLTFHILEEDLAMARQVAAIAAGASAQSAFETEQAPQDNASAVLLAAMGQLYQVLSQQNKALSLTNERLEHEVTERTRNLLQSEKMAAIGQLAAGVAHEINNPVGFVKSNLGSLGSYTGQLLRLVGECETLLSASPEMAGRFKELAETEDLAYIREDMTTLLDESQEGLVRVSNIVQALKDFAHADSAEMMDADLLKGLESTLKVAANELKYKADVVRELTPLPLVRCIPGQVNQVFMNLLVNAAQAIEQRGVITLSSGFDDAGVWVDIADTGPGIAPEILDRLFEPFFTTKPVGKGTGLGLSISWDIIYNRHQGRILVCSEVGKGTRFRVWLPRVTSAD